MTRVKSPRTFRRRRRWFWGVYVLFILLLFETGARFYWCSYGWLNFYNVPSRLLWVFYPEFRTVIKNDVLNYDADYRILLLGGSSILPPWGAIEQVLRERLTNATGRPVRIDNLGGEGHTTRDSLIKYRHLQRHRYDLVIVYDGINDCRTNNVPAELFKDDYSHYAWYHLVNREDRIGGRRWSAIPFTLSYAWSRMFSGHFLPVEMPDATMLRYGGEIKSRAPFKENLREILKIADQRGDPVMLMSFATWMPENYTNDLFIRKMLDYTLHSVATQLWGAPSSVVKGVAEHNNSIRELVKEVQSAKPGTPEPQLLFVDQAKLIPGEGKYYNDICHLTVAGSEKWVENAMPSILKLLEKKKLPPLATKNAQVPAPDQINMEL